MPPLLELKDLTVYGVVEHLNLELESGRFAQICTAGEHDRDLMVKILTGELYPQSGALIFAELNLQELNREQLLRLRREIAVIEARPALISNLKVWENITLPLIYHGGSVSSETTIMATGMLEKLGYKGNIWALPGHLKPAEKIMAAFVRAVVSSPRLIIYACLDDLAFNYREAMLNQIFELHNKSDAPAAIFITTTELQHGLLKPDIICNLKTHPPTITRIT